MQCVCSDRQSSLGIHRFPFFGAGNETWPKSGICGHAQNVLCEAKVPARLKKKKTVWLKNRNSIGEDEEVGSSFLVTS